MRSQSFTYNSEVFEGLEIFEEQQRRDRLSLLREEGEELEWKDEEACIRASVIAGLLVASWATECYPVVESLLHIAANPMALDDLVLSLTTLFEENCKGSAKVNDDSDNEDEEDALQRMYVAEGLSVNQEAEIFLESFLWLAIVNCFRRGLSEWLNLYHSLRTKTRVAPVGERLVDALKSWEIQLQHQLRQHTTPRIFELLSTAVKKQPERKANTIGPSFTSGYPMVSGISLLFKASNFHRTKPKILFLWDGLLQQKGSAIHLENELGFTKEVPQN